MKCPHCKSENVIISKKGFGLGKAVTGAVIFGPLGLLAGALGKGKNLGKCQNCGYVFDADFEIEKQQFKQSIEGKTGRDIAFSILGSCFLVSVFVLPWFMGWLGFFIGLGGLIFCLAKTAEAKKDREQKSRSK